MINYQEPSKLLHISNSRIQVEFSLDKCFCLQKLKNPVSNNLIAKQKSYVIIFDREKYDLSVKGSCSVEVMKPSRTACGNGDEIVVKLILSHATGKLNIEKHIILYDETGAVRIYDLFTSDSNLADIYYSDLLNLEFQSDFKYKCVNYYSCSDLSNHRLLESKCEKKNQGVFLIAEQSALNSVFLYKEGPVPDCQPVKGEYDFVVDNNNISCLGLGFTNILRGETRRANGIVVGFSGNTESLPELRRYQNIRYNVKAEDVEFLTNSWPAFHTDINETKLLKELKLAATVGLDTVIVDDGWFKPFMGEIDQDKFPNKFDKMAGLAKKHNLSIELWMNPFGLGSEHPKAKLWDGAERQDALLTDIQWNWLARSKDCSAVDLSQGADNSYYYAMDMLNEEYFEYIKQRIITMYQKYGISRYKFDLYKLHVLDTLLGDPNQHFEAYRRLLSELRAVIPELVISMDVTRQSRPGFDFAFDYGRLYMENRGRNHPKHDHRYYHPYITLRNLWYTAKYVPAQKLEVEIMPQIDDYPLDYILSTAIFANPLYFGSLVELSKDKINRIHDFFASIKDDREKILNGRIMTAGAMPNKGNWSLLISCTKDFPENQEFYLGVYKNGSKKSVNSFSLDLFSENSCTLVDVLNSKEIIEMKNGKFTVEIDEMFGFKLFKVNKRN